MVLQRLQTGLGHVGGQRSLVELVLQREQLLLIRRGQRIAVGHQAFAALARLAKLLCGVALIGGQHLNLLLYLCHAGALGAGTGLRLAQCVFHLGHLARLLFDTGRQQAGLVFAVLGQGGERIGFGQRVIAAGLPLGRLFGQLLQAQTDPLAAFHHETDFGFQSADLGAGLVQPALRLVDLVARAVVRLAQRFKLGLDAPQVRDPGFERVDSAVGLGLHAGLLGLTVTAP